MFRSYTSTQILWLLAVVITVLLALPLAGWAQERQQYSSDVRVHASQNPDTPVVEGASAMVETDSEGASFTFDTTQLEPGHVYTLWVAIINEPQNCEYSPCATSDLLSLTDETQTDVLWGAGGIAVEAGAATFTGSVPAGALEGSWFGNGFTNPTGAEIHLVLNDHGPEIPELRDEMLSTYRAGCTDESLPPPFPDTAKADGTPSLNTCRLVQFAIFQQTTAEPPQTLPETGSSSRGALPVLVALLLVGSGLLAAGWHIRRRERSAVQ